MNIGRLIGVAYLIAVGYMAKKYEVPRRVAGAALDSVATVASVAGKAFSQGMLPPGAVPLVSDEDLKQAFSGS